MKKDKVEEIQTKEGENGESKYLYINRYITLTQAEEELSYLKAGYDSIVERWDGEIDQPKKAYIKSLEDKIELLIKIIEHEPSRS